jgi:phosphotransferase system  glucose/maltose/N-acetylglucosamine-specific IIC component
MWGDPWGGWAFGSRYMIPTYALLAIFIAIALTKYKKNFLFLLLFLTLFLFSAFVNTAGALSSSANPPKVEVLELEALSHMQQKYTFTRNLDFLRVTGKSKSFIFITYAQKHISAWYYFLAVYGAVISTTILPIIYYLIKASKIKDFFKFLFGKVKTIYAR